VNLRYYQEQAVAACYQWMEGNRGNPVIVLPTGAGKTIVIAKICQDVRSWGGRVLVLAHVKELLEQAAAKLSSLGVDVGVYSASLKSRQKDNDITVAGVQSVFNKGFELCGSRPYDIVIVDEAHRIPLSGDGMYRTLVADLQTCNPKLRVIGCTATPYRLDSGLVYGDGELFSDVCYTADIRELIAGGFLCQLVGKQGMTEVSMSGVSKGSNGDYKSAEMQDRYLVNDIVKQSVREIVAQSKDRNKCLIFSSGVQHAAAIKAELCVHGHDAGVVVGETETKYRSEIIKQFRDGEMKYLVNVNCLTEGFDATAVDVVAIMRATLSPGLYYQMVGRGLRTNPLKKDCLILDFGGNIQRHGPIDCLQVAKKDSAGKGEAPVKACPACGLFVHASVRECVCGAEFPPPEISHESTASCESPLSDGVQVWQIDAVDYEVHEKVGKKDSPRTMRVTYYSQNLPVCSEWVCIEHTGFAYEKAFAWWRARSDEPMPRTAEQAVSVAAKCLAIPSEIKIRKPPGERFFKIISYKLGPKPSIRQPGDDDEEFVYEVDGVKYEIPF
jgi:DNA repair protein RadD